MVRDHFRPSFFVLRTVVHAMVVLGLLAGAGAAHAQTAPGGATTVDTKSLSKDEMKAFSDTAVEQVTKAAAEVAKLTEQARKDNDAGVLDCLTPRNVSMQALVQVATIARDKMRNALNTGDRERAEHEYRKIAISLDKANQIKQEANNCLAGEGGRGEGDVKISGGSGDDSDTSDNDELDDLDLGFDLGPVSVFEN